VDFNSKRQKQHKRSSCPITGLNRPTGFQEVKTPRFLDNGLTHRPPLPPGLTWYSFLEAESTPGHMELSDATEKTPAIPGIDPGAFRLVAQCLNQYATPGPENNISISERQILRKIFGPVNIDNIWRIRNNMEIDKLI
jgi:hypothetical protein